MAHSCDTQWVSGGITPSGRLGGGSLPQGVCFHPPIASQFPNSTLSMRPVSKAFSTLMDNSRGWFLLSLQPTLQPLLEQLQVFTSWSTAMPWFQTKLPGVHLHCLLSPPGWSHSTTCPTPPCLPSPVLRKEGSCSSGKLVQTSSGSSNSVFPDGLIKGTSPLMCYIPWGPLCLSCPS